MTTLIMILLSIVVLLLGFLSLEDERSVKANIDRELDHKFGRRA